MPTLSVTKTYADGEVLFESDLDNIKNGIETFVNVTKLDDDNIQDSGVSNSKIIDNTITSGEITAGTVSTSNLAANAVTTAKITDSNVTTAKIADSNVTTAKIADSNVTTAKIADGAVTYAKRSNINYAVSTSCGSFSTTSTTYVDVTNLTCSITTVGNPVYVYLIPDGTSAAEMHSTSSGVPRHNLFVLLDGSIVAVKSSYSGQTAGFVLNFESGASGVDTSSRYPVCLNTVLIPAAGSHTIKIQAYTSSGATFYISNYKLLVYEAF